MYKLKPFECINVEPWNTSLTYRINKMIENKKNGKNMVIYLYEKADTSTFRYRVYNICQSIELSLYWGGVYFFADELQCVKKYIESYMDLIIIARYRWTIQFNDFIEFARKKGKRIGFDVDDLVYDTKYIPLIMNTLSVSFENEINYDYWFSYTGRIGKSVDLCDFTVTTNQYLGDILKKDLGRTNYIIPNFMNRLQMESSQFYYDQKNQMYNEKEFLIGYFSGTPSHTNDFSIVAPELVELLNEYEDAILVIAGFMELPSYLEKYICDGKIRRLPLMNFVELQKSIAEVDLNIVPLVNNMFSNCKSELKYFEAGIVGTMTCATPSYVFKDAIQDGENGYLIDRGCWKDKIGEIMDNRLMNDHSMERMAHELSEKKYAYYNQVELIEKVFNEAYF